MNQWKSAHARSQHQRRGPWPKPSRVPTSLVGLSVKGAFTQDMVKSMADKPDHLRHGQSRILRSRRRTPRRYVPTVIMATGRSDYPNQVNNVLGFPYIFRGALDVRASTINDEMKVGGGQRASPSLAREDVPDEVSRRLFAGT